MLSTFARRSVALRNIAMRSYGTRIRSDWIRTPRFHLGVVIVPQQQAWIVERFGRYHTTLDPGLSFLVPFVDRVAYALSKKETIVEISGQSAVTVDNVTLTIDGVLYFRVDHPENAAYGIDDPHNAIVQLAQTTMRSELGKMTLDASLKGREALNAAITDTINAASEESAWGIRCLRYEIKTLQPNAQVRKSMDLQSSAERVKRQIVLDARGKAQAVLKKATARADAIRAISEAVGEYQEHAEMPSRRAIEVNGSGNRVDAGREQNEETVVASSSSSVSSDPAKCLGEEEGKEKDEKEENDGSRKPLTQQPRGYDRNNGINAARLDVAERYLDAISNLGRDGSKVVLNMNLADPDEVLRTAMGIVKFDITKDDEKGKK